MNKGKNAIMNTRKMLMMQWWIQLKTGWRL